MALKRRFKKKKAPSKYAHKIAPGQDMSEYQDRNLLLAVLGYKDYHAYLRSSEWKAIRARKLAMDPECYGCFKTDEHAQMQVHHGAYHEDNLTGRTVTDLYSICARCHRWIEMTKSGFKRTPEQATRELERVRKLSIQRRGNKADYRNHGFTPVRRG